MLNNRLVSEIIRQRMGWSDDSQAARVINLVPEALKRTGRKLAADPWTRQLVTTNPATTSIAISDGKVNLVTGYDSYQFLMEYFDLGLCYFLPASVTTPYIVGNGSYASGTWTFNANPSDGETIAVNGVTFTFKYAGVTVTGGGTTPQNGAYVYTGQYGGKPYYVGGDDDTIIRWEQDEWVIYNEVLEVIYVGTDSLADFPWEVTTWEVGAEGTAPVPVVTETALTSVQVEIGLTAADTATNFAAALNASANASITVATYGADDNVVTGTYDTVGTGGNAFTLANSSGSTVLRSASTFTGGAATAYGLYITTNLGAFADGDRVQFTTTVTLPTGLSLLTDYYIVNYTVGTSSATFQVVTTPITTKPVTITSAGSGVLTMSRQDVKGLPLQPLQGGAQSKPLSQYLSSVFNYFSILGNVMTLQDIDGEVPTGNVAFATPYYALNLAALPDSEECEVVFLDKLFELVAGGDTAEDQEK